MNISFKELCTELTREELEELESAAARTIKYDEDSPEMTEEMLKQFKRMKQLYISDNKTSSHARIDHSSRENRSPSTEE